MTVLARHIDEGLDQLLLAGYISRSVRRDWSMPNGMSDTKRRKIREKKKRKKTHARQGRQ